MILTEAATLVVPFMNLGCTNPLFYNSCMDHYKYQLLESFLKLLGSNMTFYDKLLIKYIQIDGNRIRKKIQTTMISNNSNTIIHQKT